MKCVINCTERAVSWVRNYFPAIQPYLLTVCNKPYIEYLLDYCALAGIREVRLATDKPYAELMEFVADGTRWNLEISIAGASDPLSLRELYEENRAFRAGHDLLIFNGMFRVNYDQKNFHAPDIAPDRCEGVLTPDGFGCVLAGRDFHGDPTDPANWTQAAPLGVSPLNSILSFYNWNMDIAHEGMSKYALPGYGGDYHIQIGRNVVIPRTASITAPTLLGDSIQLAHAVEIGPAAIIGEHSLIDAGTIIRESVVMGNSYVGCDLELVRKIVYRNIVIDPVCDIQLDLVDEFLLTPLVKRETSNCPFKQRFLALLLFLLQLLPFLLLRPWLKVRSEEVTCFLGQQRKRKIRLKLYINPDDCFAGRLFRKLSLDRFHLLPLVWKGELRLVGSLIFEATPENDRILRQFPDYAPGIFSFSELCEHEHDPVQREMDELYYMYHASMFFNFEILYRSLLRNLLKHT